SWRIKKGQSAAGPKPGLEKQPPGRVKNKKPRPGFSLFRPMAALRKLPPPTSAIPQNTRQQP
ncbi:hypothetical protein, partial [Delftia tsuruhatensis]|uniref:hypothetical protein n=1 Tax=Delftia tsuruhatensis TaxID=180282 RepID=UPI001969CD98